MTLVTKGNFVGDTENLPKWAREYVTLLQNRADRATAELTKLRADSGISKDGTTISIPTGKIIIWRGDLTSLYSRVEARFKPDGSLDVSAMGMGIEPCAGNRVIIHTGQHH